MKYSSLVKRIAGESAEVWDIHEEGRKRLAQGEDVIMLSIGEESDQTTPVTIQQEAVNSIRSGRNHYTPVIGEDHLRKAIAISHREHTGQQVSLEMSVFLREPRMHYFQSASASWSREMK